MKIKQKDFFCENLTGVSTFKEKQLKEEPLNMAEQKQSGLGGTKPRPQLDALGKFRMAVTATLISTVHQLPLY